MRHVVLAFVACVGAGCVLGCGSSSQSVTSPSTTKCSVTAAASPSSFSAAGGNGTLSVTTNRECEWHAAADSAWIQLGGSTSGQGAATIAFTVAANADPVARRGAIAVGDEQVAIAEDAAPCVFRVDPRSDSISAAGGRKTIAVGASSAQCSWTARSDVDWLVVVSGAQGTGNGQVSYEARATTGPTRSGTLLVAGQVVTVAQSQGCTSSIAPTSQSVAAAGGTGTISITTDAGCPWSASTNSSWVAMTSAPTGTGPGTIAFSVAPSDGPARSGTLTIDGHAFTVSQASGCRYTINPASQSIPAAGGSGTVAVSSRNGCEWSATSNAPWLTMTSSPSGAGDGSVQYSAAASTGPARSGTLTVAGQTFTVSQASGCSYALTPSSQDIDNTGGSSSFAVSTSAGCLWTATSNTSWLTINSALSGTGSGTVAFTILGNPMGGPARTGTIAVNDQTFTVNQAAAVPCAYSLSPTSQDVPATASTGSFTVNTVLTCPWSAESNNSWITITGPPSGAGVGTVNFSVAENPAGSPARTGTINLRGQTFTIAQAAGGQ